MNTKPYFRVLIPTRAIANDFLLYLQAKAQIGASIFHVSTLKGAKTGIKTQKGRFFNRLIINHLHFHLPSNTYQKRLRSPNSLIINTLSSDDALVNSNHISHKTGAKFDPTRLRRRADFTVVKFDPTNSVSFSWLIQIN
jgi:hypothetical protein